MRRTASLFLLLLPLTASALWVTPAQGVSTPPLAADDSYTTDQNMPLSVAAPGVLSNDSDADGDPLAADLATPPSHGSLDLASDGSFTYLPDLDFFGTDTFSYQAVDPYGLVDVAEVTVTVNPALTVPLDIKPGSCPNPLGVAARGVLSVAILGTAALDVSQIDPATVELEGVSPLRWTIDDVATPFVPLTGKSDAYDCTMAGPDGFADLTLKFNTQELVAALGPVADGDVLVLVLTGNLRPEFGGAPIVGEDVVVVLNKG